MTPAKSEAIDRALNAYGREFPFILDADFDSRAERTKMVINQLFHSASGRAELKRVSGERVYLSLT